jgi:hypothetical protein
MHLYAKAVRPCPELSLQSVYKPGSVRQPCGCAATIHLVWPLRDTSSNLPGQHPAQGLKLALRLSLFGFAPGGVYHAVDVAASAVRSYRTVSPLPAAGRRRFLFCGTFPKVTLAGCYPAPYMRGARTFLFKKAVARPTGAIRLGQKRFGRQ